MLSLKEAVNLCMRGVGLEGVASIDPDNLDIDASEAQSAIFQQVKDLQNRAWWFNTEPNWKLTPDELGHIAVPNKCTSIVASGADRDIRYLTIRDNKVYDVWEHTFNLTHLLRDGQIIFTFQMELDWEDLPPVARTLVAYRARRQFAMDQEVDRERWGFQSKEEDEAQTAFNAENAKLRKVNMITDNEDVSSKLAVIGGINAYPFGVSRIPVR